jgi:hypothetical protein
MNSQPSHYIERMLGKLGSFRQNALPLGGVELRCLFAKRVSLANFAKRSLFHQQYQ